MVCNKCNKEIPADALICCYCGKRLQPVQRSHRRGNGQGGVYKRLPQNTWEAKYTAGYRRNDDGTYTQVRKTKGGFKTKKEALEYLATMRGSEQREAPQLQQLWETYQSGAYTKLSKDKQTAYRIAWKRLQRLQFERIDVIQLADLQRVVNTECRTFYTAKDVRDLTSHFFQLAEIDGYVTRNLAKYLTLPEKNETVPNPFTADEQRALWADYAAGNWFTGALLLMIYSSMMPGELLACRKDCIDIENRVIVGAGKKTETRKAKAIVLADFIVPVVEDLMQHSSGEKLLTINKDNFYKQFHDTIKRLALRDNLTPYSCRHTTATALVEADIQPSVIQSVMRHAKFSSTQRYIHVNAEQEKRAVNTLKLLAE